MRSDADALFDCINLSAVDQDRKMITEARRVSCAEAPSRARQLLQRGDVLVSTVRPNLNGVARVIESFDGTTASTGFCVLRPHKSELDGSYLFHWVKSPIFVADMVKKATGASYPAVYDRIIFDSLISLPPFESSKIWNDKCLCHLLQRLTFSSAASPPIDLQREFAKCAAAVEKLKAKQKESLADLDTLFSSLQQRAFAGQLFA